MTTRVVGNPNPNIADPDIGYPNFGDIHKQYPNIEIPSPDIRMSPESGIVSSDFGRPYPDLNFQYPDPAHPNPDAFMTLPDWLVFYNAFITSSQSIPIFSVPHTQHIPYLLESIFDLDQLNAYLDQYNTPTQNTCPNDHTQTTLKLPILQHISTEKMDHESKIPLPIELAPYVPTNQFNDLTVAEDILSQLNFFRKRSETLLLPISPADQSATDTLGGTEEGIKQEAITIRHRGHSKTARLHRSISNVSDSDKQRKSISMPSETRSAPASVVQVNDSDQVINEKYNIENRIRHNQCKHNQNQIHHSDNHADQYQHNNKSSIFDQSSNHGYLPKSHIIYNQYYNYPNQYRSQQNQFKNLSNRYLNYRYRPYYINKSQNQKQFDHKNHIDHTKSQIDHIKSQIDQSINQSINQFDHTQNQLQSELNRTSPEHQNWRQIQIQNRATPWSFNETQKLNPGYLLSKFLRIYRCKQCDYIAKSKDDYWSHSRVHIKIHKQLSCPKCMFVTEHKHHLEYHLRNHLGSKPYSCTKCSYTCVNNSMLKSHMKSHTNDRDYRCADCNYATKYCHSLKLHLKKRGHTAPVEMLNGGNSKMADVE